MQKCKNLEFGACLLPLCIANLTRLIENDALLSAGQLGVSRHEARYRKVRHLLRPPVMRYQKLVHYLSISQIRSLVFTSRYLPQRPRTAKVEVGTSTEAITVPSFRFDVVATRAVDKLNVSEAARVTLGELRQSQLLILIKVWEWIISVSACSILEDITCNENQIGSTVRTRA